MLQTSRKVLNDLFKEKLCFSFNAPFFEAHVWIYDIMESVLFKDTMCLH